ncbi:uncharacterized protein BJ171DRAFT_595350 [Polychytrium aggregatum]|uniref:uncharacterized protein n=1 Tax=Polychytrium aggregatum TaxID=110093 RepID=UPI0022FDCEB9|nr:uncharacterized protein BJ171DRAFT_595350 [Polychytrium aggregatum]KAI9208907.1 hypothetical protein BJ171DRAFT_595350 [Polychytrium aggregatum]
MGKKGASKKGSDVPGIKYGRPDLDRIGLFSEAAYISTGEPFVERKHDRLADAFLTYRSKGKQFLTSPPKDGHDSKEVYFEKEYSRIFENEPYTDLVQLRRRWRLQAKDKNITNTPFKPSSVPPKPSGSGSWWGTIEQQWPLPTSKQDVVLRPEEPKQKPESKPNFLTKPPKRGSGYGYPNVTIGKSFEYVSDPYDNILEMSKKDREVHKKKVIGERPFISSSARLDYFNSFAGLIGSEKSEQTDAAASKKDGKRVSEPFKPSSCCGYTINRYPAYDPPSGPPKDKVPSKAGPRKLEPIFRPSGISKSYPTTSIIVATCPLAPPPWIQDTLRAAMCTT